MINNRAYMRTKDYKNEYIKTPFLSFKILNDRNMRYQPAQPNPNRQNPHIML